jgi:hypothetical protein
MPQAQSFTNITPIQQAPPQSFTDVTPIGDAPPSGFLSNLWSDIKNIRPSAQNPYPGMGQDEKTAAATTEGQRDQSRQAAGYSAPYRFVAPVAESLGVNVPGMEESARQGDAAGVLGHAAAVPVTYAATRALGAGADAAVDNAKPAWRMVGKATTAVGDSLDPDVVGLVSPRAAHALRLRSKVGRVASKLGAEPAAPVNPGAPLPVTPPAELLQAGALADLPATGAQPASQTGEALATVQTAPWRMKPQAAALGDTPQAAATISQQLDNTLRTAVGNQAVKPGVPMRYQFKTAASAEGSVPTASIPEGHTPVEDSTAVRSFKYDPDAQELHIAPTKGYTYVYGDVSPDQATGFQNAESKGTAWGSIRNSNPLVAKIHENGTRTAITPTNTAPSEDLTRVLQKSVDAAKQAKWKMKAAQ